MKSKKHILLVDDVTTNLRCLGEILRDEYSVSMAKSGEQAVTMFDKARPDLILMDVKMPGMDGYETYECIKKLQNFSDIPVIFLTADTEMETEIKSFKVGGCDFIRKPYEPEILKERINRVLVQDARNREIQDSALRDTLTGLYNRKFMLNEFSKLPKGSVGTLMILDLDNFKGINDTYGHVVGDAALVAFAKTLTRFVHKDDIVARIGGDEFAVYLRDCCGKELLSDRVADLIKQVERELAIVKKDDSTSSVSIGISSYPADGKTFVELYNNADKALYYVKNHGKSDFRFYDPNDKYTVGISENVEAVDLLELRPFIEEHGDAVGPINVEYQSFKSIYRFLKRYSLRTGCNIQLLLFSFKDLSVSGDTCLDNLPELMDLLEECIKDSLRKNDVSTRYSDRQQLVILMDLKDSDRLMVVQRIMDLWNERNKDLSVLLKYDIEDMVMEGKA